MRTKDQRRTDERGMALVIAMLVLLVLTLLGTIMMTTVMMNRRVAGQDTTMRAALNNAEAGIGEAESRIRNSDAPMPTSNPRSVCQIFLAPAGSIPVVGPDTTAMGTLQPAGQWLNYSSNLQGPDVLTINFKTNATRDTVFRYDPTKTPAVNLKTGVPIYEVTSTGKTGNARTTVVSEVIPTPVIVFAKGALAAGVGINFVGNAAICGFDHLASTPPGTGDNARGNAPDCIPYEVGPGIGLPASWSTGAITNGGASYQVGYPADSLPNQTGFYAGPWEMLGMSQSQFINFVGAPVASPTNLNGINYVDNDGIMGNQSTSLGLHGVTGEGLLYVDGDLTLNSTFTYIGLVYVEGNLQLNGTAWILGGVVVRGKATINVNGGATILYSSDAIMQKLAKYGGRFTTLSWRQK